MQVYNPSGLEYQGSRTNLNLSLQTVQQTKLTILLISGNEDSGEILRGQALAPPAHINMTAAKIPTWVII